jgi:enamine deaminase RidA (YjgF/YER057c/UK114 family)
MGGRRQADLLRRRRSELPTIRAVRDEFVDTRRPPTSSLVQVAGLVSPDFLLEVEAVAWLP